MAQRTELESGDRAWLRMESPESPMVVSAVVELDARLSPEIVEALVERLAAIPRFASRIVPPAHGEGREAWESVDGFEPRGHVDYAAIAGRDALHAFIGAAVSRPLDPAKPLWRLYAIDVADAGTTLLFRVHHAVGDGFALLAVLTEIAEQQAEEDAPIRPVRRDGLRLASAAMALGRIVFLPADPPTALRNAIGTDKRVAWSSSIPLEDVKRIARAASATVNDVLVAVAAGAVGRALRGMGDRTEGVEVRAMVPVNLRPPPEPGGAARISMGNRFGLVLLGLPLGIEDAGPRILAVHERMQRLKTSAEPAVTYGVVRAMGRAPRWAEDLAVRFFAKKTSLVLTNVPGPRAPLRLAGARIARIVFWVPQAGHLGLGISIFSYAGEVTLGVLADTHVLPDPGALVADMEAELATLRAR